MKEFRFNVQLTVKLQAFNAADAAEAVHDALEDIDALGASVTGLRLDLVPDES